MGNPFPFQGTGKQNFFSLEHLLCYVIKKVKENCEIIATVELL